MIVAHHQPHAAQAARPEAAEQVLVVRSALPAGDADRQDLPLAIVSDSHHDERRLAHHLPSDAHVLVGGVHQHERVRHLPERTFAPGCEVGVQGAHQAADGGAREAGAAQRLGDVPDLPG